MEKRKKTSSYIYMLVAAIGMLLLVVGLLESISLVGSTSTIGFLLIFTGFMILVHYIYYLEKKTGISNKVIWIKGVVLGLSIVIFTYTFY